MVHELLDHGEHVIVVDDLTTGFRGEAAPPAELVVGDIGDTKLIAGLLAANSVNSILHFAAKTVVPNTWAIRCAITRTTPPMRGRCWNAPSRRG